MGIRTPELGWVFMCLFWVGKDSAPARGADGLLAQALYCSSGVHCFGAVAF